MKLKAVLLAVGMLVLVLVFAVSATVAVNLAKGGRKVVPALSDARLATLEQVSADAYATSQAIQESKRITIRLVNSKASPDEIEAEPGENLLLTLRALDENAHVWVFRDQIGPIPLPAGSQTVPLRAPLKKGEYTLECTEPGHRAAGEIVKLIVQ